MLPINKTELPKYYKSEKRKNNYNYFYETIFIHLLISVLFSTHTIYAQESTSDVEVYFNNGQVIFGDIFFYDSTSDLFDLVNSSKKTYHISEIKYYKNSDILVRRFIYKNKDKLFIAIVEGKKMSLYKTEKKGKTNFFVYKDNKIYELEGGKIEIEKDGDLFLTENLKYQITLKNLLNSDSNLNKKIDNIKFREEDFKDFIVSINRGQLSYIKSNKSKKKKKILFFFLQYSNEINNKFFYLPNSTPAFFGGGMQLKFSKNSRHSIKFTVDYGKYTNKKINADEQYKYNINQLNLEFSYLYNFYRMPHSNIYVSISFLSINNTQISSNSYTIPILKISPNIGYEYQVHNRIKLFAELNLLNLKQIPYNFSIGLAYKL